VDCFLLGVAFADDVELDAASREAARGLTNGYVDKPGHPPPHGLGGLRRECAPAATAALGNRTGIVDLDYVQRDREISFATFQYDHVAPPIR
jgi:hypothetical protein